jgi:peptidoglycan/LPS O-acetylase OafA/YrhL
MAAEHKTMRAVFGPGAFRLFLATAVFVSHVSHIAVGGPAVLLFFTLSGFWVSRMQAGEHHQPYGSFMVSRFLRIWPLLAVVALCAAGALTRLGLPLGGNLPSTLALLGLATRKGDVIGTAWSLDVEMQFYILLPLFLHYREVFSQNRSLFVLLAIAFFISGCILYGYLGIITCLLFSPLFCAGIYIFIFRPKIRDAQAFLSFAVGSILIVLVMIFGPRSILSDMAWGDTLYMIPCLLMGPFVAWNVAQPSGKLDRLLGNLSYPFYLVHFPAIQICMWKFGGGLAAKVLALLASALSTLAFYLGVDVPIEHVRKSLRLHASKVRPKLI